MTKIIIDTNIVFSAILNINSRIGQVVLVGSRYYEFFSPEYIRHELLHHKEKIKLIGNFSDDDFVELFELVLRNITVLRHSIIPVEFFKKAEALCRNIDIDDTPFVATTDFMRGRLWTGDKILTDRLISKGYNRIISTSELHQDFLLRDKGKSQIEES